MRRASVVAPSRSRHALQAARIEDVVRKGGFTYLGRTVNGVGMPGIDIFRYEWPGSKAHTYFLEALDWVAIRCTCKDFSVHHLPCKHCEALQKELWEALQRARAEKRRRERAREGCWAEMPAGSGSFVWMEEFGLTEREIEALISTSEIMITAQERSNTSGLNDERMFRRGTYNYTQPLL